MRIEGLDREHLAAVGRSGCGAAQLASFVVRVPDDLATAIGYSLEYPKYPVKVQAIRSKGRTDRFHVFIPLPLAAAIGLEAWEECQWSLTDRYTLSVHRQQPVKADQTRVKDGKPSRK